MFKRYLLAILKWPFFAPIFGAKAAWAILTEVEEELKVGDLVWCYKTDRLGLIHGFSTAKIGDREVTVIETADGTKHYYDEVRRINGQGEVM